MHNLGEPGIRSKFPGRGNMFVWRNAVRFDTFKGCSTKTGIGAHIHGIGFRKQDLWRDHNAALRAGYMHAQWIRPRGNLFVVGAVAHPYIQRLTGGKGKIDVCKIQRCQMRGAGPNIVNARTPRGQCIRICANSPIR